MKALGRKKIILVVIAVVAIAITTIMSAWAIITPKWSFSVTTDKATYELGENVQITVTLKNLGFVEHSFKSAVNIPFVASVEMDGTQVWYSPFNRDATEFTVPPHQSLERTFTWNQTNTANPWFWNQTYMSGTYSIVALVPKDEWFMDKVFIEYTTINITEG